MIESCAREVEVVGAVLGRRWNAAHEDLKLHATDCDVCRDAVALAALLAEDEERTRGLVRVPAAGQVWWRSAIRARLEAAQAAARPLTWAHGVAAACAVGLTAAVVGMAWPSVREVVSWLASHAPGDSGVADAAALVSAAIRQSLPVAFVVAACVLLAPVALYFALSDD